MTSEVEVERGFTAAALRLWGGLLVWAGYFLLVYVVTALACARGFADAAVAGIDLVTFVSAAGFVVAMAGTAVLVSVTRRRARAEHARSARFADRLGWTLGLLALLAIVWTALPHLLLRTGCA
jgi:hypothetical protein